MTLLPLPVLLKSKHFQYADPLKKEKGYCYACGKTANFKVQPIITDSLAGDWELSGSERTAFDRRESLFCEYCSNSLRTRMLAKVLVVLYGSGAKNLRELSEEQSFGALRIAEINACGNLHQFLTGKSNITYSEFGSVDATLPSEDLQDLTYKDENFDLVITSETLEHVPDLGRSLGEIRRVLKPGGKHIFTIPVILNRKTRDRIRVAESRTTEILPKSYHGEEEVGFLVVREIGADIIDTLDQSGFITRLHEVYPLRDTHSYVFVCTKQQGESSG